MLSYTLLDGGTGRELKAIGAPFRQPEWSAAALLEGPDCVTTVHERFADAGADVITTNSYAVVPFHIGAERWDARGAELAALSGSLARRVAASRSGLRVAGSLPPIGGSYRADLFDAETARPVLAVLIRALAPYVDLFLAETLSCIAEARLVRDVLAADRAAAELAGHVRAPLELWISYTLDDEVREPPATGTPSQPRLRSGELVADAVNAALHCGAGAVLFNCSQPEVMGAAVDVAVATVAAAGSAARVGVYANAFPPQGSAATANATLLTTRAELTPAAYAAFAADWVRRGATIIGGCCGVGAEHIAALHAARRGP